MYSEGIVSVEVIAAYIKCTAAGFYIALFSHIAGYCEGPAVKIKVAVLNEIPDLRTVAHIAYASGNIYLSIGRLCKGVEAGVFRAFKNDRLETAAGENDPVSTLGVEVIQSSVAGYLGKVALKLKNTGCQDICGIVP